MQGDERLERVLAAIDAANSADPERDPGTDMPAALLYGARMSEVLQGFSPDAGDHLQIAARGQHIERWTLPRSSYPEGRTGYLDWRRAQYERHAARVGEIMSGAGYAGDDIERVGTLLRKTGIKRDPEVQALEDVACIVFVRWYFADFAEGREEEDVLRIVRKTARKMSPEGRAELLKMGLPDHIAAAVGD